MSDFAQGQKVLLIEDNPGDARLIEILLDESDFTNFYVDRKETLKEGLEALDNYSGYEAVLLDLSLPDSNGFPTLEKLLDKHPNANVIVLTGFADKSMGLKAVQAGAQDFLVKDRFDADHLSKSLRFSMERKTILKRLEDTQKLARIGNWEYDEENQLFKASKEIYRIFDLLSKDKINPVALKNENHPFHLLEKIHQRTAINGSVNEDLKFETESSKQRHVSVQCRAIKNGEKLIFQGVIQDISDRKIAEEEMTRSKKQYQDIFTTSKDAIFIASIEGKLLDCNQATLDLLGVSQKEDLMAVKDIHEYFAIPEKRNEFLLKVKFATVVDFEIDIKRDNGEIRTCLVSANMQQDDQSTRYNAIIRDITEQKRTEELVKARDLAQEAAKLKEEFMANISHEMRTPMNAIFGMSNLLGQTTMNNEQRDYVKSIHQSSEVLLGIVNDILEIATIQNGKLVFDNEDFNLKELLFNVINVMQYKANEKDIFLELNLPENIPSILKGDKLRVNQVFFNLVGNAVKFTDSGHVKIIVEKLGAFEGGVHLKFIVEDTGIGIPKDKLDSVFESFSRVRSKDRIFEGTGLGLAIAKNLIELQGGKIGATSEVGIGSKFFFDMIFEIAENQSEINLHVNEMEVPDDLAFNLLLVEDHKMNQLVASKTLKKKWKNIEITIADNGKIAIDTLKEKQFDIILMDLQMPIMDGYQTTQYIRNQMPKEVAALPILAMTAHAHISKDEKYKEYGMNDFVLKPFKPEQLFSKIFTYLQKHEVKI